MGQLMGYILGMFGVFALFFGGVIWLDTKSAIHQIAALVTFLIGWLLIVGGMIITKLGEMGETLATLDPKVLGQVLINLQWIADNTSGKSAEDTAPDRVRKCPHCAEEIRREASKCRFCQSSITPEAEPAAPPVQVTATTPVDSPATTPVDSPATSPIDSPAASPIEAGPKEEPPPAISSPGPVVKEPPPELPPIDRATFEREFHRLAEMNKQGALSDAEFAERRAELIRRAKLPTEVNLEMKVRKPTASAEVVPATKPSASDE